MNYETALLGAILRGYPNIPEVSRIVTASDFGDVAHEQIWLSIRRVFKAGELVNPLTVLADMGTVAHKLPGGATYLTDLDCPSELQAPMYAEKVREQAIRRSIHDLGLRCQQIENSDIEPRQAVRLIRDWADGIDTHTADVDESAIALERVIDIAENGEPNGVQTPWRDLTEILGGWYPGQLVTIGARPGVGKSIMLENICSHMAVNGKAVKFFSLEMSATELMQRRMAHTAGVELSRLRRGGESVSERDWQQINRAVPLIQSCPIDYTSRTQTIDSLTDLAWEFTRKAKAAGKPIGGVFVDYCQLVEPSNRKLSRQQQLGEVTRGLKRLAGELDCPVFQGAQVSRQSQQRTNPMPMLHDLREAGDIEQDSDVVIFLHEETVEDAGRTLATGELLVSVAKSRNTSKSTITLRRYGHYARLESI